MRKQKFHLFVRLLAGRQKYILSFEMVDTNENADNKRFGNRLAEGITIGCSSLSALVPADEQISAFCI